MATISVNIIDEGAGGQQVQVSLTSGKQYSVKFNLLNGSDLNSLTTESTGLIAQLDGQGVGSFLDGSDLNTATFTFTSTTTGEFLLILLSSGYGVNYTVDFAEVAAVDVEALLNDALVSVKTYVDSMDASVKVYADGLIAQLMNTTDLTVKMNLLSEINAILDGDTATAGFQLWQANVAKLNQVVSDFDANKTTVQQQITTATQAVSVEVLAVANSLASTTTVVESNRATAVQAITVVANEVATLKANSSTPFIAMKAKAALLFAV